MLVIVPSRERPQNVARLGYAAQNTMGSAGTLLWIFDDDDPQLDEQVRAAEAYGWAWEAQERLITVPKFNKAAMRHVDDARIIMYLGDDHIPRTQAWDELLVAAIDSMGGTGFAYPWGMGRADVPEVCAISSDIIKALGWMGYPGVRHFYVDNVWGDLGTGAECITFLQDVILEHMHWTFGKGPIDHLNHLAIGCTPGDEAAYNEWRATRMADDVAIIRQVRELGRAVL